MMQEPSTKGVCRLSVVPLRREPSDSSEMTSQLLFGDHYEVLEQNVNKWLRIRLAFDQYEGWIDARQHYEISEDYYEHISNTDYKITTDLHAHIFYKREYLHILLGSVLPIATNELFKMEEQLAFDGSAKSLHLKRDHAFIKEIASKYLNAPYLWGGRTPFGIDCSGFTQIVFKIAGYQLARDSKDQALQGTEVPSLQKAQEGDLAFFKNDNGKITHVGIVLEGQKIIHASGKVRVDQLTDTGIVQEERQLLTHKLASLRRIIKFSL